MKTKMEYINEMEQGNVLLQRELTFPEYAEQLMAFQDIVCKMIARDAYHEGMRMNEATFIVESDARKKGLSSEPAVHNGVLTLRQLSKEMAITMSGIKGEQCVSKTLEYMSRPNTQVFRNVYVSDGQAQTELDAVVLTDGAAIILEMKKVKSDITLTADGRMVFANNECYDDVPLCEKMKLKRKLLKTHLEKQLAARGLDIPAFVDSYIVFSAPKGQFIHVDDRYHCEKYCFRTGLNKTLENYLGCAYYKASELEQLGEIISEMKTHVKRFETRLDFDEIRQSLAEAMVVLHDSGSEEMSVEPDIIHKSANPTNTGKRAEKPHKDVGFVYVAVGVLLSGLAAMAGVKARRSYCRFAKRIKIYCK